MSYGFITSPQATSSNGGAATILVAGMKQNTLYHMRAVATLADGSQTFDADHTFQTGTIPPQRIPAMKVTTSSASQPAAGVELMCLTQGSANQLLALATDPAGNVVWYYDYDSSLGIPQPIKLLPNGHMLLILYGEGSPGGTVQEIDLAGNVISQFDYKSLSQKLANAGYSLQVFSIDHDFVRLSNADNRQRHAGFSQICLAILDKQPLQETQSLISIPITVLSGFGMPLTTWT